MKKSYIILFTFGIILLPCNLLAENVDYSNKDLTTDLVKSIGCKRFESVKWKSNNSDWNDKIEILCPVHHIAITGSCWRKQDKDNTIGGENANFIGSGSFTNGTQNGWQCAFQDSQGISIEVTCCKS